MTTTPDLKKLTEVKRYRYSPNSIAPLAEAPNGALVYYSDIEHLPKALTALQQEVETLRATLEYNEARLREWMLGHARQRREMEILQERLAHARQETLEEAAKVCDAQMKLYDECRDSVADKESVELYKKKAAIAYCLAKAIRALPADRININVGNPGGPLRGDDPRNGSEQHTGEVPGFVRVPDMGADSPSTVRIQDAMVAKLKELYGVGTHADAVGLMRTFLLAAREANVEATDKTSNPGT